jgi:hypothetical protein
MRTRDWTQHRRLRRELMRDPLEESCIHCDGYVDKSLPGNHPKGPQLGHKVSRKLRPDLEFDRSNVGICHALCNQRAGVSSG